MGGMSDTCPVRLHTFPLWDTMEAEVSDATCD